MALNGFLSLPDLFRQTITNEDCIEWLRQQGLLSRRRQCQGCGTPMLEAALARCKDGVTWRCPAQGCRLRCSIRKDSFFERSYCSLRDLVDLMYFWSEDLGNTRVLQQVRQSTVKHHCNYCLVVLMEKLHIHVYIQWFAVITTFSLKMRHETVLAGLSVCL